MIRSATWPLRFRALSPRISKARKFLRISLCSSFSSTIASVDIWLLVLGVSVSGTSSYPVRRIRFRSDVDGQPDGDLLPELEPLGLAHGVLERHDVPAVLGPQRGLEVGGPDPA